MIIARPEDLKLQWQGLHNFFKKKLDITEVKRKIDSVKVNICLHTASKVKKQKRKTRSLSNLSISYAAAKWTWYLYILDTIDGTISDHISGTPTHCYPMDKLDESLTICWCSESGRRDCTPLQEQTMVSLLVNERTNFMYINFELHRHIKIQDSRR